MAASSIVSMLLEGGSIGEHTVEMPQYTLENGAALIARECAQELHDIFEVAIVETNEAALGAYLEGNQDVMESATYGPVFEAAEKSGGEKIIELLKNLRDRVVAFFKNIGAKLMLVVGNYEKFYESKKEELEKAKALDNVPCIDWNEENLGSLADFIKARAGEVKKEVKMLTDIVQEIADSSSRNRDIAVKKLTDKCNEWFVKTAEKSKVHMNNVTDFDLSQFNAAVQVIFKKPNETKRKIDSGYIVSILKHTKEGAKGIQVAQKEFNSAYNDAIKNVEQIIKKYKTSDAAGYTQYLHKVMSTITKVQSLVNSYAQTGYRCYIGRANEAKHLANVLISGKVPGEKKSKDNGSSNGGNNNDNNNNGGGDN